MYKQKILFHAAAFSFILGANQLAIAAETTAAAAELRETTPLYLSGIVSASDADDTLVTIRHNAHISYTDGKLYDQYLLTNTSDADASYSILLPQLASLAESSEPLAEFDIFVPKEPITFEQLLQPGDTAMTPDYQYQQYFTPVFSASGLNENTISLALLAKAEDTSVLPEDSGVLFGFTRTDSAEALECLSITDLSENCHIYPYGCSYAVADNGYTLSISEGFDTCYVFLTGAEDTDFQVSPANDEIFTLSQQTSQLDDYLIDSCERYLSLHPDMTETDFQLLLSDLAAYFGKSNVTVSIDLLPTIEWLSTQKRYAVNQYTITVPAGETICAQLSRDAGYTTSANPAFVPVLASPDSNSPAVTNTVSTVLPEGYSSLLIRGAQSKKLSSSNDEQVVTYQISEFKDTICSVVLFQTPIWTKTMKYLPVFAVIMAVFMLLCLVSYLSRKKK